MANISFTNCNDILDYLSFLERKVASLKEELGSLRFSIFSREAKERKKLIKCNLKSIYQILEDYEEFLCDATTFLREDLDIFFAKYFTALYGIEYTYEGNAKDNSEGSYLIPTDIIASKRDFARIDKKYNFKRKVNVDDIVDMCQDSCLCIGGPEEYNLLEGTTLSPELEGFPEIVEVVKILVDLKLSDPNLSDKKRLALGLKIAISRLNKKTTSEYTQHQVQNTTYVSPQIVKQPSISKTAPEVLKSQPSLTPEILKTIPIEPSKPKTEPASTKETEELKLSSTTKPPTEKVLTKSLMGKYLHR